MGGRGKGEGLGEEKEGEQESTALPEMFRFPRIPTLLLSYRELWARGFAHLFFSSVKWNVANTPWAVHEFKK